MIMHIPRQRDLENRFELGRYHDGPLRQHKVRVDRHAHGPHSPLRWRAWCLICHGWWWPETPDGTHAGWLRVLEAAVQHATDGSWPDRRDCEPSDDAECA